MAETLQPDWPPKTSAIGLPNGTHRMSSVGQLWFVLDGAWARIHNPTPDQYAMADNMGIAPLVGETTILAGVSQMRHAYECNTAIMHARTKVMNDALAKLREPIPMVLWCPVCGTQHIDKPQLDRGWDNPPHRSHECQGCGLVWRPADVPTTGVERISTKGKQDIDLDNLRAQIIGWRGGRDS